MGNLFIETTMTETLKLLIWQLSLYENTTG